MHLLRARNLSGERTEFRRGEFRQMLRLRGQALERRLPAQRARSLQSLACESAISGGFAPPGRRSEIRSRLATCCSAMALKACASMSAIPGSSRTSRRRNVISPACSRRAMRHDRDLSRPCLFPVRAAVPWRRFGVKRGSSYAYRERFVRPSPSLARCDHHLGEGARAPRTPSRGGYLRIFASPLIPARV